MSDAVISRQPLLSAQCFSLDHQQLFEVLAAERNLLIIQDLDGVCMGLVSDPLRRRMDPRYIHACQSFRDHFFVLTNGEHIGSRGVNSLVDAAMASQAAGSPAEHGLYLPGLAAGGVQYQDSFGALSHPGVSDAEMTFLASVPALMRTFFRELFTAAPFQLDAADIDALLAIIILDNAVSPTVNIGSLFDHPQVGREHYAYVQKQTGALMAQLLADAAAQNLSDSFFVHLAPNLGTEAGAERMKPANGADMGTTDFQFMLRGAIKEVGVLVLLNQYYQRQSGHFPLGEDFNARNAPQEREQLLALAAEHFDPAFMPRIIGVGDTVTSSPVGSSSWQRGGSDRGFLSLVQDLNSCFQSDNAVVFVDSSGGELNRPGIDFTPKGDDMEVPLQALSGVTDAQDPLRLNFLFPQGHQQYIDFFLRLAAARA